MKNIKFYLMPVLAAAFVMSCGPKEEIPIDPVNPDGPEIPEEPADPTPQDDTTDVVVEKNIWANISDGDQSFNPGKYNSVLTIIPYGGYEQCRSWVGSAWGNDHAAIRLDFLTYDEGFPQVSIETSDFVSENGSRIGAEHITAGYLIAVDTESENYPDITHKIFDIIGSSTVQDFEAGKIYSAWVDIFVPEDTPSGIYKSRICMKSNGELVVGFDCELEVFDMNLTEPEEWETFLDLWEYPFASNRYYSGLTNTEYFNYVTPERQDTNPFSLYYCHLDPRYQAGLESELELYHKAGGNAISVTTVEDPFNSRLPCPTPSMIKWTMKEDGTFTYDYTDMDYWVDLNIKHGIDRQIDLFFHTGVGWGFVHYDEAKGEVNNDHNAQPSTDPRWHDIAHDFLQDLVNHLEEKGWFDMAVLYMDERLYDVTKCLVEAAESVTNSKGQTLKVGGAVNGHEVEPLYDRMYDVSIWENAKPTDAAALAESRRAKGLQTTFYSCGSGKMSATNEPAEAAYAVYEARKYKMDGVMRWAFNKFDYDPIHALIHQTYYPGDCYLIYPDEKDSPEMKAQSTPRFEKLCEGMRVTEKLNLIRKLHPEYAAAVEEIVSSLRNNYIDEVAAMRTKVADLSRAVQNGEPAPALR